jgi:hypothetical protein
LLAPEAVDRPVHDDPLEPGTKGTVGTAPGELPERAADRFLSHVLGVDEIAGAR